MEYRTLKDLLLNSTTKYSEIVALQIRGDQGYKKYTYKDVRRLAGGLISYLRSLGINKGDRVILLSENRPEWVIAYLSIVGMGSIVVPLDSLGTEYDLKGVIKHSESKAIITSLKFLDMMKDTGLKMLSMENEFEGVASHGGEDFGFDVGPDDIASIVYTSGTTGIPKGVMLSHGNLMSNMARTMELFDIGPTDRLLSVLPIHHTLETAAFLAPFYCGAGIIYAESLKSFKLLANMQDVHPTILVGVPMMFQLFYDGIMREVDEKSIIVRILFKIMFLVSKLFKNLLRINIGKALFGTVHKKFGGSFRFFISGGAAISVELLRNFDYLGFKIIQGYGLTESSPIIAANSFTDNKFGSVGRPIPGVKVKIVNGEIVATGPNIMKGYFKMKEETDKVLRDGWLYTGDVGFIDSLGYLYITGRYKDVIIASNGVNVYPDEIEFELNKAPYIKESCVIGRKIAQGIKKGSEEVFAVVIPNIEYFTKLGLSMNEDAVHSAVAEVIEKFNDRSSLYKRISAFSIRNTDFPKTSTKKIKRFAVKKEMEEIWKI